MVVSIGSAGLAGLTAGWALATAGAAVRLYAGDAPVGGALASLTPTAVTAGGRTLTFPAEAVCTRIWRQDRNLRRLMDTLDTGRRLRATRRTAQILLGSEGARRIHAGPRGRDSRLGAPLCWLRQELGAGDRRALTRAVAVEGDALDGRSAASALEGLSEDGRRLATGWLVSTFWEAPEAIPLARALAVLRLRGLADVRDSEYAVLSCAPAEAIVAPLVAAIEAAGGTILAQPAPPEAIALPELPVWSVTRLWFLGAPEQARADAGEIPGSAHTFGWLHRLRTDFAGWREATGGSVLELACVGEAAPSVEAAASLAERVWPELAGSFVAGVELGRPAVIPTVAASAASAAGLEAAVVAGLEAARGAAEGSGRVYSRVPACLPPHPFSTEFLRVRAAVRRAGRWHHW